jgi:hypothetical protein
MITYQSELLRKNAVLNLARRLDHGIDFGLGLLALVSARTSEPGAPRMYSPRRKAFTRCSLVGKRALTDFSPIQSSLCVLRSMKI